jgi:hypothetical protein
MAQVEANIELFVFLVRPGELFAIYSPGLNEPSPHPKCLAIRPSDPFRTSTPIYLKGVLAWNLGAKPALIVLVIASLRGQNASRTCVYLRGGVRQDPSRATRLYEKFASIAPYTDKLVTKKHTTCSCDQFAAAMALELKCFAVGTSALADDPFSTNAILSSNRFRLTS